MQKPNSVKTTFATYTLTEKLGEGGSGVVYAAMDERGESVAIKFLDSKKASREKRKRFKNELSFCSQQHHQNIVEILDNGITEDDAPFFVMPRYENSLRVLMGKVDIQHAVRVWEKVANAVDAAHKLKVTHRDIKPENILINGDASKDLVLADFGIAHFEQEDLYTAMETRHQERLANFQYAAPEQRERGHTVDHRADLYSLGLLLNELITGRIPAGTGFRRISDVSDAMPFLDEMVDKMLAQNPASRYGSVEEVKMELQVRGIAHTTTQKLKELGKVVIPTGEIDDPIAKDPMRVVGVDWHNGVLTISLNHKVNDLWKWALNNMGNFEAVWNKGPNTFQFQGPVAQIGAGEHEAKQILTYFKEWLPKAHEVYVRRIKDDLLAAERDRTKKHQQQIEREQQRLRVLQSLS